MIQDFKTVRFNANSCHRLVFVFTPVTNTEPRRFTDKILKTFFFFYILDPANVNLNMHNIFPECGYGLKKAIIPHSATAPHRPKQHKEHLGSS